MSAIWPELMGVAFRQHFIDAKGIRTRVIEAGEGEPLIFLHGTGGHAEAYARNIAAHSRHFRVCAIDMVGHGYTDAPLATYDMPDFVDHLAAVVDALGAPQVSLSGESLGAMVAAFYAIAHPTRVRRLVMNTGMLTSRDEAGKKQLLDARDRSEKAAVEVTREAVRARLAWLMANPEASITEELVTVRHTIYSQPGRAAILKNITSAFFGKVLDDAWMQRWSNPEALRQVKCPTLVLWSTHNPGLTAERAAVAAAQLPDHRMVVLEDCGHWPQWEQAEAFNRHHLDFLLS